MQYQKLQEETIRFQQTSVFPSVNFSAAPSSLTPQAVLSIPAPALIAYHAGHIPQRFHVLQWKAQGLFQKSLQLLHLLHQA